MNKIIIHGHITKNPETRMTQSGKNVCSFCIAVNDDYKRDETDFFNCIAWDKLAERVSKFLSKGSEVIVSGKMKSRSYEKDGQKRIVWELVADSFDFCGSKTDAKPVDIRPDDGEMEELDGELPF